jgi:hypothetical protein
MKANSAKWLVFFLVLFGLLGYLRENFFVYTNSILSNMFYNRTDPNLVIPGILKPLESLDYKTLYYMKYPFTILWTMVFLLAGHLCLKKLADDARLIRLLYISYAVMFVLAGLSIAYSYLTHGRAEADQYTLSRWLMGIAQSPLVCLILLAGSKLAKLPGTA